jgi:glycosyltransferase involved in cell wall biosynthesis
MSQRKKLLIFTPSLRISGGIKEVLRFAEELRDEEVDVIIISLWKSAIELPTSGLKVEHLSNFETSRSWAWLHYPILLVLFLRYIRKAQRDASGSAMAIVVTHFSTFPLAWLAPSLDWYCFNQDVEWMFVADGFGRTLLRRFILATSRRAKVITTNAFIEKRFEFENIASFGRASIWPPTFWLGSDVNVARDLDVMMFLRRGHMKRLDLYLSMLDLLKAKNIVSCVVTPDPEIADLVKGIASQCFLRPSDDELKSLFERSKVFLLLSDTEGFALPPLEAMGSGCVPLCRDSGGPQCYMVGELMANLIPLAVPVNVIMMQLQEILSDNALLSSLSDSAKLRFKTGMSETSVERDACIHRVAADLNAPD